MTWMIAAFIVVALMASWRFIVPVLRKAFRQLPSQAEGELQLTGSAPPGLLPDNWREENGKVIASRSCGGSKLDD